MSKVLTKKSTWKELLQELYQIREEIQQLKGGRTS